MCADLKPRHRASMRGLSLIELLIGLVIGLLVSLASLSSVRIFANEQRHGSVAGTSVVNSAAALGAIKNDVAAVGLGFFDGRRPMCDRINLSTDAGRLLDGGGFSPLRITRSEGNDQIDVFYARDVTAGAPMPLVEASNGGAISLTTNLPASVGHAVLLAPEDTGLCTLRTVTAVVAGTPDTAQVLTFGATGRHNMAAFTNAPAYPAESRAVLMGNLSWNRYRLVDGNLVLEQPLAEAGAVASSVLVRNVIALRAEYGVSDAGGTTLASWQDAGDAGWGSLTLANIGRVRALRLGILTRIPQREKPDANGDCITSAAKPRLFGEEVEPDVSDWRCYRYRSNTLVVPLRNLVWGQQP